MICRYARQLIVPIRPRHARSAMANPRHGGLSKEVQISANKPLCIQFQLMADEMPDATNAAKMKFVRVTEGQVLAKHTGRTQTGFVHVTDLMELLGISCPEGRSVLIACPISKKPSSICCLCCNGALTHGRPSRLAESNGRDESDCCNSNLLGRTVGGIPPL